MLELHTHRAMTKGVAGMSLNGQITFYGIHFNQTLGSQHQSYTGTFSTDAHHTLTLCYDQKPCTDLNITTLSSNHIEAVFSNGDTLHLMR